MKSHLRNLRRNVFLGSLEQTHVIFSCLPPGVAAIMYFLCVVYYNQCQQQSLKVRMWIERDGSPFCQHISADYNKRCIVGKIFEHSFQQCYS